VISEVYDRESQNRHGAQGQIVTNKDLNDKQAHCRRQDFWITVSHAPYQSINQSSHVYFRHMVHSYTTTQ